MTFEQFTRSSQDALQRAQQMAEQRGHQAIDTAHLLAALADDATVQQIASHLKTSTAAIKKEATRSLESLPSVQGGAQQYMSQGLHAALTRALEEMKAMGDEFAAVEHVLVGLATGSDATATALAANGMSPKALRAAIQTVRRGERVTSAHAETTRQALERYAINLNARAQAGKLDPVIGRDEEIRRVMHILSRRTKNNPVLVGEPGVGKTAIAEGIAMRIVSGDVPESIQDKTIWALDMGALMAGAKYKGEFEERLKSVVNEVVKSDGQVILFIDEIHTLVGAGRSDGAMDAANILKPALARGELRSVGATTLAEFQKWFESDKALERRFQKVMIDEPSEEASISILRGLKERYEAYHKVRIKDDALIAAVELSSRYISDRFLPDKAIDLVDEAAAKLRLEVDSVPEELDEIQRKILQLEIEREAIKREADAPKLEQLEKTLAEKKHERDALKGRWQEEKSMVDAVQACREEIESWKLEAEKAERVSDYARVAEIRYGRIKELEQKLATMQADLERRNAGEANKMLREEVTSDDIAEIVSRWTGIPVHKMVESERRKLLRLEEELHKRVVGQEEAISAVSDAIRRSRAGLGDENKPIGSFIFLGTTGVGKTELAKALAEFLFNDDQAMVRIDMSEYQERHAVSRLIGAPPGYVGYDEGGQLTEAVRRKPYSVVLLDEIEKAHPDVFNILLQVLDDGRLTDNKGRVANFKNTIVIMTSNLGSDIIRERLAGLDASDSLLAKTVTERTKVEIFELLKRTLRPEFLNRVDECVMFKPLAKGELRQIVSIQLDELREHLAKSNLQIEATEDALLWLAERGWEPEFGARPLKRILQRKVVNELSKKILAGDVTSGDTVLLHAINGELVITKRR